MHVKIIIIKFEHYKLRLKKKKQNKTSQVSNLVHTMS